MIFFVVALAASDCLILLLSSVYHEQHAITPARISTGPFLCVGGVRWQKIISFQNLAGIFFWPAIIQESYRRSKFTGKMAEKIDKAKKRKRKSEDSSKPSKKVAIERTRSIQISMPETDKWAPIIGMVLSSG